MGDGPHWVLIDPDVPGYCLGCLSRHRVADLNERVAAVPRERPYPGRCLICRGPCGPLRPLDNPVDDPPADEPRSPPPVTA